ncbi:LCP family protein [Nocardioides panaciterrulae]|uniref:LCP family protein required for cell wall assembly n=1 Tax=Nocardioides panaciterrulae TaxID=661492 RepID=A0A7Y9E4M2_9ACTN|nr:LCP family protein [Nocardioides panaciterrulae]NYD40932.1 LCP family protein required for cell wall assembly [Nocardioides panaciterrulae]
MPPVSSPGLHDRQGAASSRADERAARVRFRRAMALMLMTLIVPGSAQLVAGNRKVGRIALRIWLVLVVGFLATLVVGVAWHELVFWLVSNTLLLGLLRIALMAGAIGWALLFVDAWRIGQPLTLSMGHRRAAVGLNGVLCLSVAGSLLFGAHLVGVQRDFMLSMFGSGTVSGAHDGRFNVLLMGGDSGAGRWGLRTDSMTVASIDEQTGKTVLIGVPRNMTNFPFAPHSQMAKYWPKGFNCGYPACELNGVNTWVGDNLDKFKGVKDPGVTATISAIEGITGLKINYWAMVNLQGFKDLVDAVGGVTLNVRQPIPVGGLGDDVVGYIQPGVRKLDGHDTLWFARSRDGSDDYSRMARQKCVMSAMLSQISPQVAVRNFEKIAKASSAMISTDVPASEVDRFISLALKAKSQKIATLSLVPPLVNTAHPDIALIQRKVAEAVDPSAGTGTPKSAGHHRHKQAPQQVTGGSLGSLSTGYAANHSEDLAASC